MIFSSTYSILFIIIGIALVGSYIWAIFRSYKAKEYTRVDGMVRKILFENSNSYGQRNLVTVEFFYNGVQYRKTISRPIDRRACVGQPISLLIDPINDEVYFEDDLLISKNRSLLSLPITGALALIIGIIGILQKFSKSFKELTLSVPSNTRTIIIVVIAAVIFSIVGVILIASYFSHKAAINSDKYRPITAKCVDYTYEYTNNIIKHSYPVFEFFYLGEAQYKQSEISSIKQKYKIGQNVTLYQDYDSGDILEKPDLSSLITGISALLIAVIMIILLIVFS